MSPGDANERKPKGKRPAHRPASTAKPLALTISKAKRERYLEGLRNGVSSKAAANAVGLTGSRFRSLAHNDPDFAALREAALYDRHQEIAERGRDEMVARQLGDNLELKSDRGLHNLLILVDPEYRAAHRQGATVNLNQELEITNVHIAIEGARDRLVQKLAPVLELAAARNAEDGDRVRAS